MAKFHPIALAKKHPLVVVLFVGVGILAIVVLRGGSSSSGASVAQAGGPSDAQVSADAAVTQSQIAAGAQTQQIQGQIIAQTNQNSFQLAEDQINANTAVYQTNAGAQVSLAGIGAQKDVQLAGIAAGVQVADLSNQAALAQAGIYKDIITSNNDVQVAGINASEAIQLAPYQLGAINTQAGVETAQILGSKEVGSLINHATSTGGGISIGGVSAGGGMGANNGVGSTVVGLGSVLARAFG